MSDVRSLLRTERASRRIDHPNASYSSTGSLECNVCWIPLKPDAGEWNRHLKSTQHAMRAERLRIAQGQAPVTTSAARPTETRVTSNPKKRKINDNKDDSRKRNRPVVSPPSVPVEEAELQAAPAFVVSEPENSPQPKDQVAPKPPENLTPATIDEDEWAAFERDVATPPPDLVPASADASNQAVISAAPVSAAELAAQEREKERESGKERREAETEAEKEDATRAMEEELDEMEGLDQKIRRLKERREELRLATGGNSANADVSGLDQTATEGATKEIVTEDEDEDDSDVEGDDFEGWGFGR